jgi:hypothetical protein
VDVRFITGMAHAAEQVITLIDLDTVAAHDPLDALEPSITAPDTSEDA